MAKFAFGSDTNGSRADDRVDSDGNAGGKGNPNANSTKSLIKSLVCYLLFCLR